MFQIFGENLEAKKSLGKVLFSKCCLAFFGGGGGGLSKLKIKFLNKYSDKRQRTTILCSMSFTSSRIDTIVLQVQIWLTRIECTSIKG